MGRVEVSGLVEQPRRCVPLSQSLLPLTSPTVTHCHRFHRADAPSSRITPASGEHHWGKCTWANGQCPQFKDGPECLADPASKDCLDEGRHAMWHASHDAAACTQVCVDPATKLNCGSFQAVIMDDTQQETMVEWTVGRDIQHFCQWVAGGVAAYTLKTIHAGGTGGTEMLAPCIRAIIVLVLGTLLVELITIISSEQSCNDTDGVDVFTHVCDPSSTAAPVVTSEDPILQCEEQRDLHSLTKFCGSMVANIYFVWIISSYEKSVRDAPTAAAAGGDGTTATQEPV